MVKQQQSRLPVTYRSYQVQQVSRFMALNESLPPPPPTANLVCQFSRDGKPSSYHGSQWMVTDYSLP